LVGKGDEEETLKVKLKGLKLDAHVKWINWLPQEELAEVYMKNDLFLFPSLHDSGGMVVLEAMSFGLPIVCFDIGGPGYFVNKNIGLKVNVLNKTYNEVVADYATAIIKLSKDRQLLIEKSINAKLVVSQHSWSNTIDKVYTIIENDFNSIIYK